MIRVENQDAVQNAKDASGVIQGTAVVNQMRPEFTPVLDCTPDFHRNITTFAGGGGTTGNVNAYIGRPGKQLYVVGCYIGYNKNAACDAATGNIGMTYVQEGQTKTLISIPIITLTAEKDTAFLTFPYPIKCDVNTDIIFAATFTAGIMRRIAIVYGYELNP